MLLYVLSYTLLLESTEALPAYTQSSYFTTPKNPFKFLTVISLTPTSIHFPSTRRPPLNCSRPFQASPLAKMPTSEPSVYWKCCLCIQNANRNEAAGRKNPISQLVCEKKRYLVGRPWGHRVCPQCPGNHEYGLRI